MIKEERALHDAFDNCDWIHKEFREAVKRLVEKQTALDAELAITRQWVAELRDALGEARDALNGAPNTVGLHNHIAHALTDPFAKVPA